MSFVNNEALHDASHQFPLKAYNGFIGMNSFSAKVCVTI